MSQLTHAKSTSQISSLNPFPSIPQKPVLGSLLYHHNKSQSLLNISQLSSALGKDFSLSPSPVPEAKLPPIRLRPVNRSYEKARFLTHGNYQNRSLLSSIDSSLQALSRNCSFSKQTRKNQLAEKVVQNVRLESNLMSQKLTFQIERNQAFSGLLVLPVKLPLISGTPEPVLHSSRSSPDLARKNHRGEGQKPEKNEDIEEEDLVLSYVFPISSFDEVLESAGEDAPGFSYLGYPGTQMKGISANKKVRKQARKRWKEMMGVRPDSSAICSCSRQQFVHPSLHYKQLFLRSSLKEQAFRPFSQLRLLYKKSTVSSSEEKKSVLVLLFEGVLGDWEKSGWNDRPSCQLLLRKQTISGLLKLALCFRMVLISSLNTKRIRMISGLLQTRGIELEAVYSIPAKDSSVPPHILSSFMNYTKISSDLQISDPATELLILTRLDMSHSDAEDSGSKVLYSKAGTKLRLHAAYLPIQEAKIPITMIVPSIRSQESENVLTFDVVVEAVMDFYNMSGRNWAASFSILQQNPSLGLLPFPTCVVHEVLMSYLLPPPTADGFLHAQASHRCALHQKLAWGMGPSLKPFCNNIVVVRPTQREVADCEIVEMYGEVTERLRSNVRRAETHG